MVEKGAQVTGDDHSFERTCRSFTKSGLRLESVHQEPPRDVSKKRATWTFGFHLKTNMPESNGKMEWSRIQVA